MVREKGVKTDLTNGRSEPGLTKSGKRKLRGCRMMAAEGEVGKEEGDGCPFRNHREE